MNTIKALVYDLSPHNGLGDDLRGALGSVLSSPSQVKHERFVSREISQAPKQFSSILASYSPDAIFLSWDLKFHPVTAALCESFSNWVSGPALLTALIKTNHSNHVARLRGHGITDFLYPPIVPIKLLPRLLRCKKPFFSTSFSIQHEKERLGLEQFVGQSPALLKEIYKIPSLAQCESTVLITGETGTGKEICAQMIHQLSPRRKQPFVPINCGSFPAELVENELFGHSAGAYTGATTTKTGVVLEAHGGTLFLDEIDTMCLSAQVKLLRFLETREFKSLGTNKRVKVNVRVVAASNAKLEKMLEIQHFREDLYYRLNVMRLHMPPLRERENDIVLLAEHFLVRYATANNQSVKSLSPSAQQKLLTHRWPGNVRELENIMERAIVDGKGETIQADDISLPPSSPKLATASTIGTYQSIKDKMAEIESTYLLRMLDRHNGNVTKTAEDAGIGRRSFYHLMHKYQLSVARPQK